MTKRIPFALGDRQYEARSFSKPDEKTRVDKDTMMSRTDEQNGGGIGKEDGEYISERLSGLPDELDPYLLACPRWCNPDDPRAFRYFGKFGHEWEHDWVGIGFHLDDRFLVICRIA